MNRPTPARRGSRRAPFAFLLACALGVVACVPDRPVRTATDRLLAGVPCASGARAELRRLGASHRWISAPPGPAGGRSHRAPTRRFAEWAALAVGPDSLPTVSLVTPDHADRAAFNADCGVRRERLVHRPSPLPRARRFTDGDLARVLSEAEGRPVVVYVWAPHMPLSPDGWPEIEAAAESLGMRVVPVLMSWSDGDFAAREAARVGMPDEGLRVMDANELVQRQARVHAPSIVIFGAGRTSPVLPGYRNAAGYRRYLEAFLDGD